MSSLACLKTVVTAYEGISALVVAKTLQLRFMSQHNQLVVCVKRTQKPNDSGAKMVTFSATAKRTREPFKHCWRECCGGGTGAYSHNNSSVHGPEVCGARLALLVHKPQHHTHTLLDEPALVPFLQHHSAHT